MNNMKISNHFFFVPLRTLNTHFAEFMFNNKNGDYSGVLPYTHTDVLYDLVSAVSDAGTDDLALEIIRLYDFIGLPFHYESKTTEGAVVSAWLNDTFNTKVKTAALRVNLCPFFAYQKIWSEYYRDENLVDDPFDTFESLAGYSVFDLVGDQDSNVSSDALLWATHILRIRPRAWAHDRFTSALPFAQRGPDVLLPLAGTADVQYKDGFTLGTDRSGLVVWSHTLEDEHSAPLAKLTSSGSEAYSGPKESCSHSGKEAQ